MKTAVTVGLLGFGLAGFVLAQDAPDPEPKERQTIYRYIEKSPESPAVGQLFRQVTSTPQVRPPYAIQHAPKYATVYHHTVDKRESGLNRRVAEATRKLNSDDEQKRAEALKELEDALEELFDVRTESREKQIADLEKRLQTLRTQLTDRKTKKAEIVRLRIQTVVNEANGLGF